MKKLAKTATKNKLFQRTFCEHRHRQIVNVYVRCTPSEIRTHTKRFVAVYSNPLSYGGIFYNQPNVWFLCHFWPIININQF